MVDSDGVCHAFDDHVAFHNDGFGPDYISDDDLFALIDTLPDFWRTIPVLHDAQVLIDGLAAYEVVILTGCPKVGYDRAAGHKVAKFAANFPGLPVLTCPSRYKPLAAAVHLGLLPPSVLAQCRAAFLDEGFDSPYDLARAREALTACLDALDLGGLILIDDRSHNCKRWVACGGRAILHRTAVITLNDLQQGRFFDKRARAG